MDENVWLEPIVNKYKDFFGNEAKVIFDVGSRDGHDAEYLRVALNGSDIYAIDANPKAAQVIRTNYPSFHVIESAVSDYEGNTKFTQVVSDHDDLEGCSSIEKYIEYENAEYHDIEVPVTQMKTIIEQFNLVDQAIDIMKVDVEGFTYECITGLGDCVRNVKLFHLETETFHRHEGHRDNNRVIDLMLKNGFLLCDTSYQWGESIQDQIWVNPRLFSSDFVN